MPDMYTELTMSKQFSSNLRRERKLRKLSREKMAELCDISVSHYHNLEAGRALFPSFGLLVTLMLSLQCGPERLFYNIIPIDEKRTDDVMAEKISTLKPAQKQQVNALIEMCMEHNSK